MTSNTSTNIDIGKPKIGGYAFRAPVGTTLPADVSTELTGDFENMGYVSTEGLQVTYERASSDHRDWGGDVVETTQDEYGETYTVTFLESRRASLLKVLFGDDNVEVTEPAAGVDGEVLIKHNSLEPDNGVWVFSMKSRRSARRIVMPTARVTGIGDIAFVSTDLIRYQATIKAYPDGDGNCSYERFALPA